MPGEAECGCGMGPRCLLVQRAQEQRSSSRPLTMSAPRQPRERELGAKLEWRGGRAEAGKMARWNNIADLTRHRETIKVSRPDLEKSWSVVSYNILADCHMEPDWYQYTPDTARTALQRHPAILAELEELGGDILCLQEVGLDYEPHLSAELRSRGYTGAFHPKTMGTMEGCATYWRTGQFEADLGFRSLANIADRRLEVVEVVRLSWNELLAEECARRNLDPAQLDCARPHVALVTKLRHAATGRVLTVGNIHTVWDNFTQLDVTTLQVSLALARLAAIAEDKTFVLAGDLNSRTSMAPYCLLHSGQLSKQQRRDLASVATASCGERSLASLLEDCLGHDQPDLSSSYLSVKGSEPELTNYDDYDGRHPADWTLDYIWYTADTVRAEAVLDTMGVPEQRCPNQLYPSDHLSLKTTFSFI